MTPRTDSAVKRPDQVALPHHTSEEKLATQIGQNVVVEVDKDQLIIRIDLTAPTSRSASGKTMIVAKTMGPTSIPETDVTLNLQAWRK